MGPEARVRVVLLVKKFWMRGGNHRMCGRRKTGKAAPGVRDVIVGMGGGGRDLGRA